MKLPEVPVRQWVLSLPYGLRYRMAYDARLVSDVLGVFVREVFASQRRRSRDHSRTGRSQCGAVTFVQRSGDALNLNVHFHMLVLDGLYAAVQGKLPRFERLAPPSQAEVALVATRIASTVARLLERRGLGLQADPEEVDGLAREQPLLAELYRASVSGRVATGPRAGRRVATVGDRIEVENLEAEAGADTRCATVSGLSLHAEVCVPAHDRMRIERLCRYVGRPPLAQERLSRLPDGRLLYRLKRRWRNGTTHVVFEPLEFIGKLAALVPPPRFNLVRYHGILAPAARWRSQVLPPGPDVQDGASLLHPGCSVKRSERLRSEKGCPVKQPPFVTPNGGSHGPCQGVLAPPDRPRVLPPSPKADGFALPGHPGSPRSPAKETDPHLPEGACPGKSRSRVRPRNYSWSELLKRVFSADVFACDRCGGRMRILAAIHPPAAIRKILDCLGLPSRPPPIAAALPEHPDGPEFF